MSEPIPETTDTPPDARAAAALVALIDLLHTDPLARPLLGSGTGLATPWFYVFRGELHLDLHMPAAGAEQVAAASALFGAAFTVDEAVSTSNYKKHVLHLTWHSVPLQVTVEVAFEDELAAAKKRIAELEAGLARREGALAEQRHQVLDPSVPPPAYTTAATAAAVAAGVTA